MSQHDQRYADVVLSVLTSELQAIERQDANDRDHEASHSRADQAVSTALRQLGATEAADTFNRMARHSA